MSDLTFIGISIFGFGMIFILGLVLPRVKDRPQSGWFGFYRDRRKRIGVRSAPIFENKAAEPDEKSRRGGIWKIQSNLMEAMVQLRKSRQARKEFTKSKDLA